MEQILKIHCSPVVRTNPVTGWKSLFGAGHQIHAGWIDNVTETESETIKAYCEWHLNSSPWICIWLNLQSSKWLPRTMISRWDSDGIKTISPSGTSEFPLTSFVLNGTLIVGSRSVFHTATNDYEGKRQGNRVVSLGEKPFYNPASKSRREALFGA